MRPIERWMATVTTSAAVGRRGNRSAVVGQSGAPSAAMPRARTCLGVNSPTVAPASRSATSTRSSSFALPALRSTSISRNFSATRRPSGTLTLSSTTSTVTRSSRSHS
jgi:hypothetical protein